MMVFIGEISDMKYRNGCCEKRKKENMYIQ